MVVNGFNLRPWNGLDVFDNLEMMVQKLSATDVLSSVGRLLVYTFVPSSIIKVIKYSFSIASFTTSCNNSELFFAELTISRLTEREPTAVPNTR